MVKSKPNIRVIWWRRTRTMLAPSKAWDAFISKLLLTLTAALRLPASTPLSMPLPQPTCLTTGSYPSLTSMRSRFYGCLLTGEQSSTAGRKTMNMSYTFRLRVLITARLRFAIRNQMASVNGCTVRCKMSSMPSPSGENCIKT